MTYVQNDIKRIKRPLRGFSKYVLEALNTSFEDLYETPTHKNKKFHTAYMTTFMALI